MRHSEIEVEIVIPLYNEIEIVEQLHARVLAVCKKIERSFRIVYVDDGSSDGTPEWIADNAIAEFQKQVASVVSVASDRGGSQAGKVTLLRLSRNFGHAAAIDAGLNDCQGKCVVVMDGDLQDPPELIEEMVARWDAGDEIVIAQRTRREETFVRGIAFKAFHKLFGYLADSDIPRNTGTFCLMDRRATVAINTMKESHRFLPGLRAWVGFRQSFIKFERPARAAGQPKQTFVRLFKYALDAIFAFSFKPLRLLTFTGAGIFFAAIVMASWFVAKRLMGWETATVGFTTLMATMLAMGGFQLMSLGLLGEYIGRIYDEVKNRPHYLVHQQLHAEVDSQRQAESMHQRAA